MALVNRRQGLGLLGGLAALGAGPVKARQAVESERLTTYRTRGQDYPVVIAPPLTFDGEMTGAAIMLLHGSGGLGSEFEMFRRQARRFTAQGYWVVMPSYFSDSANPAQTDDVDWWLTAVTDAAAWTAALPGVDPERLGALGYSRGGYLAGEAAVQGTTIKAVVGVASAGNVEPGNIVRRPEVLLIHARRDPVIPRERTTRWARILREHDIPVETVVLPVDRHSFDAEEWDGIFERADGFFRRILVRPSNPSA